VTSVRGSATVNGQAAETGAAVAAGTSLATSAQSSLDVNVGVNGPTISLMENTRVSVDDLTFDTAGAEPVINTKLSLKEGAIYGVVRKTSDQSSYKIEAPNVTYSVRGPAHYLVRVDGNVNVWQGCVNVAFRGINYNVCAGQAFDPGVPGVVENTVNEPHRGGAGAVTEPPKPVGPVSPVSPVAPGRN